MSALISLAIVGKDTAPSWVPTEEVMAIEGHFVFSPKYP